ncbi:MAG: TIGR00153 family protein [Spirochaetia bacterium]
MRFLWSKEKQIIEKIRQFTETIDNSTDTFVECLSLLFKDPSKKKSVKAADKVHNLESKADDIRREIEYELYHKALIPESRGDILELLEEMDDIPGIYEKVSFQITLEDLSIPSDFHEDIFTIIEKSQEAWKELEQSIERLIFGGEVESHFNRIDALESECDLIERKLIRDIFSSKVIKKMDKILIRDIVMEIGDIPDQIQGAADKVSIAIIKRRL